MFKYLTFGLVVASAPLVALAAEPQYRAVYITQGGSRQTLTLVPATQPQAQAPYALTGQQPPQKTDLKLAPVTQGGSRQTQTYVPTNR